MIRLISMLFQLMKLTIINLRNNYITTNSLFRFHLLVLYFTRKEEERTNERNCKLYREERTHFCFKVVWFCFAFSFSLFFLFFGFRNACFVYKMTDLTKREEEEKNTLNPSYCSNIWLFNIKKTKINSFYFIINIYY